MEIAPRKNLYMLDVMKFIGSILVICGHVRPFTSYSMVLDVAIIHVFARIVVPFFFMTAGYLFYRKIQFPISGNKENAKFLFKYIKRILVIYMIWYAAYLAVGTYVYVSSSTFSVFGMFEFVRGLNRISHLWYLPALMLAMLLVYLLLSYLSYTKVLILGSVLFLIGLFGDSYYGLIRSHFILGDISRLYIEYFQTTRNGLFFGMLYVTLGAYLAKHEIKLKQPIRYFLLFLGLMFVEVFTLRALDIPRNYNMILFAVPVTWFLFNRVIQIPLGERKIYKYFRDGSLLIYCAHPLFILAMPFVFSALGISSLYKDSLVRFFAVTITSMAFSFGIVALARNKYLKWLKIIF